MRQGDEIERKRKTFILIIGGAIFLLFIIARISVFIKFE